MVRKKFFFSFFSPNFIQKYSDFSGWKSQLDVSLKLYTHGQWTDETHLKVLCKNVFSPRPINLFRAFVIFLAAQNQNLYFSFTLGCSNKENLLLDGENLNKQCGITGICPNQQVAKSTYLLHGKIWFGTMKSCGVNYICRCVMHYAVKGRQPNGSSTFIYRKAYTPRLTWTHTQCTRIHCIVCFHF